MKIAHSLAVMFIASLASARDECVEPVPHEGLAFWADRYVRWNLGGDELPQDSQGNAVLHGTVLLPIPQTAGDGTPGSVDVTLDRFEPFTVQLWALFGTSYDDGTPPDPFEPVSIFETLHITVRLDGMAIITADNALDHFTQFAFSPPIAFAQPPFESLIWYQGIGLVHGPLGPGQHTLELDAVNTEPAFGNYYEYHNTWRLTVE